jgi:uncharacterized caspase-like protein
VHDAADNTFNAQASVQLGFADANIRRAKAASEQFTVSGLGSGDNGAIRSATAIPPTMW